MKSILVIPFKILIVIILIGMNVSSYSQITDLIKYQAILRNSDGSVISNKNIDLNLSIKDGLINGLSLYSESHNVLSNSYGLINLYIGSGTTKDDFSSIDWSLTPLFIEISVDMNNNGNFDIISNSQLSSVPYSFFSKTALSVLNDSVDDADNNPYNEFNTGFVLLNNKSLEIIDGGGSLSVDLNSIEDTLNELQQISKSGNEIILSHNGGIIIDSVGVYYAGSGINIDNNIISSNVVTYSLGLNLDLGGYVFWVSPDGLHGLVVETIDQGNNIYNWYTAKDIISNPNFHSPQGSRFRDWRLPTKYELVEIYNQRNQIGGFGNVLLNSIPVTHYWSSIEDNSTNAMHLDFNNGLFESCSKTLNYYCVRSVREF